MDTIETTAGVLLIVAAASLFGWVLTTTQLTEAGAAALNDFIVFATQITEIKVGEKNIEG